MRVKESDKKAVVLFATSVGAYILAFVVPVVCERIRLTEEVAVFGFLLFVIIGALSAGAYGDLPEPEVSLEFLEEMEQMIIRRKNDICDNCKQESIRDKEKGILEEKDIE